MNKKILNYIIIIILILIFSFSIYKIINWNLENESIKKQLNQIKDVAIIETQNDSENIKIIKPIKPLEKTDSYYNYINMKLINVSFDKLKQINKNVVGWLQVAGTTINFPFVQTTNNEYYLKRDFENNLNSAGWIFMDYRNNKNNFDKNTVIYGHSRTNKLAFGTLDNTLDSKWYNNKDNHIIKLSTETENTLWQIFSIYHIPNTSDYLKTNFNNDNEYETFLDMISKRTKINFNTNVYKTDKIITLSTCYGKERLVVHAKLIKSNIR